jgi:hypothetical protein
VRDLLREDIGDIVRRFFFFRLGSLVSGGGVRVLDTKSIDSGMGVYPETSMYDLFLSMIYIRKIEKDLRLSFPQNKETQKTSQRSQESDLNCSIISKKSNTDEYKVEILDGCHGFLPVFKLIVPKKYCYKQNTCFIDSHSLKGAIARNKDFFPKCL